MLRKTAILLSLLLFLPACYQMKSANEAGTNGSGFSQGGEDGDDTASGPQSDYQFIGANSMRFILSQELGLQNNSDPFQKLNEKAESLGEGDPSAGRPHDYSFSALKGKIATEVFIDACALGLNRPNVRNRLFPNGATDASTIYERFLGREADSAELDFLSDVAGAVSPGAAAAAVCATVLSSLEALNRS